MLAQETCQDAQCPEFCGALQFPRSYLGMLVAIIMYEKTLENLYKMGSWTTVTDSYKPENSYSPVWACLSLHL